MTNPSFTKKSRLFACRVPNELADQIDAAIAESDSDKTSWLLDAYRLKLGLPADNPEQRLLAVVERLEQASDKLLQPQVVSGMAKPLKSATAKPDEQETLAIVANMVQEGRSNREIAECLNGLGISTAKRREWKPHNVNDFRGKHGLRG